jgi:hypothetical protein
MPFAMIVVWSSGTPTARRLDLPTGQDCVLGRDQLPGDDRLSATHFKTYAREYDYETNIVITELGSKNGTFVDGVQVRRQELAYHRSVIRAARTVGVIVGDAASERPIPVEAVPFVEIPVAILDRVRARAPQTVIHASAIERCLLAGWRDRAHLDDEIDRALERQQASTRDALRAEHLIDLPPLFPDIPFATVFEEIMKVPPPFPIPQPYRVSATSRSAGVVRETMIGTEGEARALVQAALGQAFDTPPGWFQCGFSGHGINSYSLYFGRTTERAHLMLRLPYGDGVYCSNPAEERAAAIAAIIKYNALIDTLPCKSVELLDSLGVASYTIERLDGSVVRSPPDLYSLDSVDLVALASTSGQGGI